MNIIGNRTSKIKQRVENEQGDLSYFTIFFILAINMLVAFVLLVMSVKIHSINIRNAVKIELNNMSARIYADTFHSQREANLDSYLNDLQFSSAYQASLRSNFIDGLKRNISLENEKYRINNIQLNFKEYKDKIEYIFSCEIYFQIYMFGKNFPTIKKEVVLTGTHRTKY